MVLCAKKDELLSELKAAFNEWKSKAGFKASFEDLEKVFFIEDYILATGFVSPRISRMICARIRDFFNSWSQLIHSWLVPQPYSLVSNSEHQLFNDDEKEILNNILSDFMSIISKNTVVSLTFDEKKEAEFVDEALVVWNKNRSVLVDYSKRVEDYWLSASKND